jgi:fimbrial isopeptide formation D2 family protein
VNNKYTQEKGQLTLKKSIAGATLTADKTYYFTIQRKEGEDWKYCVCDDDGVMTGATDTPQYVGVTVSAGQKNEEVQITDVPFGYYAIVEVNNSEHSAELAGLVLITDGGKTVEVNNATTPAVAEFTNTYYGAPEFQKKIEDKNDTTGETSGWQDSADYDIGDDIRYQLTVKLPDNVTDYYQYYLTFHDKMEDSLTFQKILSVKVGNTTLPENGYWLKNVTEHSFELKIPFEEETNKTAPNHNAVKIQNDGLNGATVEVIFTAKLNEKAKLGTEGNVNGAYLEYSNNCSLDEQGKPKDSTSKTELDAVIAFTYLLNINKVDEDGKTPLEGAEFKLEKKLAGGKLEEITRLTVKEKKTFCFKGLDDGDYILTETKVPAGHLPAKPITFTVTATYNPDWTVNVPWNTDLKDLNRTGILTKLTGTAENGVITLTEDAKHAELTGNVKNESFSIKVQKTDIATGAELSGATIQILDHEGNKVAEWVSVAGQPHEVTGLVIGETYTLHEVVAPKGYLLTADTVFSIDENGKPVSGKTLTRTNSIQEDGSTVRNDGVVLVEDQMKTSVAIRKAWDDDDNRDGLRPAGLEVTLLANGEASGRKVTLNTANHWAARLDDLPLTDRNGKTITYTWQEPTVEGYTLTSSKADGGILTTLTNTHGPEKTAVSVKKVWADNNDAGKKRPASIEVQLFADGIAVGKPVTLSADNEWAYSWKDLCLNTYENGASRAIRYTVAETEIPDDYVCKVTGNAATGFVITNTLGGNGKLVIVKEFDVKKPEPEPEVEEETTDFEVQKIWVDDNDNADGNRPESITVRLYAGGQEIKVVKLTASNGWKYHFGELPKFVNGKPIHYSVKEDPVEGYSTEIDGFTIYNKYQPEMTQVTVRKIWNDENNKDQKRPTSIWMKLNNGMTVILNEGNGWTATIAGLPAKVNGKPAEYTWTEQNIIGYELESMVTEDNITIFTNRLWTRPDAPSQGRMPKTAGDTVYSFEEYDTPLGVEIVINHVGDCFD